TRGAPSRRPVPVSRGLPRAQVEMKGDDSETHEGARLSRPAFHGFLPSPLVGIPTTRRKARHVPEVAGQRGRARLVLNRMQPPPAGGKKAKEKPMPQKYGQKASAQGEGAPPRREG